MGVVARTGIWVRVYDQMSADVVTVHEERRAAQIFREEQQQEQGSDLADVSESNVCHHGQR